MAVVRGWSVQEMTSNQKRKILKQRLSGGLQGRTSGHKVMVAGSHASSAPAKSFPSFPVWWRLIPPL